LKRGPGFRSGLTLACDAGEWLATTKVLIRKDVDLFRVLACRAVAVWHSNSQTQRPVTLRQPVRLLPGVHRVGKIVRPIHPQDRHLRLRQISRRVPLREPHLCLVGAKFLKRAQPGRVLAQKSATSFSTT